MMTSHKELIEICVSLLIASTILIREYRLTYQKKTKAFNQLNQKIVATLIRHGGRMNRRRIGIYLNLPERVVAVCIAKLEKKGVIYRQENDDVCLKE
jgi:uncharacterized membrane protein